MWVVYNHNLGESLLKLSRDVFSCAHDPILEENTHETQVHVIVQLHILEIHVCQSVSSERLIQLDVSDFRSVILTVIGLWPSSFTQRFF